MKTNQLNSFPLHLPKPELVHKCLCIRLGENHFTTYYTDNTHTHLSTPLHTDCTHTHTYRLVRLHTQTHPQPHTYTHTHRHTRTHINTHTHTHKLTHTHTPQLFDPPNCAGQNRTPFIKPNRVPNQNGKLYCLIGLLTAPAHTHVGKPTGRIICQDYTSAEVG